MKIGDKIPEILGQDAQGRIIKASDFAGKKLIIYFYPKDNTPGCTAEACSLSEGYGKLMKAYYAEDKTSESASKIVSEDVKKASSKNTSSESYGKVSEAAGAVQSSIEKIRKASEEDTDLLVSAVKSFVKSYNSMIEAAADKEVVNDSSISSRITVLSSLSNGL